MGNGTDLPLDDAPGSNPNIGGVSANMYPTFPDTGSWVEETAQSVQSILFLVQPRLNACPNNMLIQALWLAARRFARESESWRENFQQLTILAQYVYPLLSLQPYQNVYIQRIISFKVNGLDQLPDSWWLDQRLGTVKMRYPSTQAGLPMVIEAVLMPEVTCDAFPAWWLNKYAEPIVFAVLADLKSIPGRPYSDDKGSLSYEARYRKVLATAKRDVQMQGKAPQQLRPGEFY